MKFTTLLDPVAWMRNLDTSEASIKALPNFYRYDLKRALDESENSYVSAILRNIEPFQGDWKYSSIDSRGVMLMKGWYPCIPGWHCDDFYRPTDDQPVVSAMEDVAPCEHYMIVIGDCSLTEFPQVGLWLPDETGFDLSKKALYSHYDELLNKLGFPTVKIEDRTIYRFGQSTFHRCLPAHKAGWRWFLRCTFSNHREPKNEIRNQIQVYVDPSTSW